MYRGEKSNLLVNHALGDQRPAVGDVWRSRPRRGEREIQITEVDSYGVSAVATASGRRPGRRTRLRHDTLIANYVKVDGNGN